MAASNPEALADYKRSSRQIFQTTTTSITRKSLTIGIPHKAFRAAKFRSPTHSTFTKVEAIHQRNRSKSRRPSDKDQLHPNSSQNSWLSNATKLRKALKAMSENNEFDAEPEVKLGVANIEDSIIKEAVVIGSS